MDCCPEGVDQRAGRSGLLQVTFAGDIRLFSLLKEQNLSSGAQSRSRWFSLWRCQRPRFRIFTSWNATAGSCDSWDAECGKHVSHTQTAILQTHPVWEMRCSMCQMLQYDNLISPLSASGILAGDFVWWLFLFISRSTLL